MPRVTWVGLSIALLCGNSFMALAVELPFEKVSWFDQTKANGTVICDEVERSHEFTYDLRAGTIRWEMLVEKRVVIDTFAHILYQSWTEDHEGTGKQTYHIQGPEHLSLTIWEDMEKVTSIYGAKELGYKCRWK